MRVEQALRLLPDLEALVPLRARVFSSALPDDRVVWASAGPYLTVGKREISPAELRRRTAQTFHLVTEHLSGLYEAYVDALECLENDDASGAVSALLKAGRREEAVGRAPAARAWYDVALGLAEALPDRRPEIQALLASGRLGVRLGQFDASGRHYQRALALAEAEFDQPGAIAACRGLGDAALERGEWGGAQAWYSRALRLADAAHDAHRTAQTHHVLGELARRKGDAASAVDHLRRAREQFEQLGDATEMARLLNTQGQVDVALGQHAAAAAAYREALAWCRRGERDPDLQIAIRVNLAELQAASGRRVEAEDELRRAEQLAIGSHLLARLAEIYAALGSLRGLERDETGFVFFEEALELARMLGRAPLTEARIYRAYGAFRHRTGQTEEARAYLERAQQLFESAGVAAGLASIEAELGRLSA